MAMDLVFILKLVKSVTGCLLYIFHPSGLFSPGINPIMILQRKFYATQFLQAF